MSECRRRGTPWPGSCTYMAVSTRRRFGAGNSWQLRQQLLDLRSLIRSGIGVPLGVLAVLAMIILPLPPLALDVLFTFNIALSLIVVMAVFYVARPLDFGVFPTVLLLATLLRLALNVASTRVVLLHGHTGSHAAGQVIESFGEFVIGGNYAVGVIVFAILTIINFVVVTKGAGRISEVTRALHPRRDARQADGDRRRSQRRPDHPGRSARAPRRKCAPKRTSTARWTAPASSSAATRSPAS